MIFDYPTLRKEREGWERIPREEQMLTGRYPHGAPVDLPRFPVRSSGQDHVCAFLLRKGAWSAGNPRDSTGNRGWWRVEPKSAFFSSFSCRRQASLLKSETWATHSMNREDEIRGLKGRPPGSGRIIAEQLLSLTRIQTREPLPAPGLPIRLRI